MLGRERGVGTAHEVTGYFAFFPVPETPVQLAEGHLMRATLLSAAHDGRTNPAREVSRLPSQGHFMLVPRETGSRIPGTDFEHAWSAHRPGRSPRG
jgi:hypothetical protein